MAKKKNNLKFIVLLLFVILLFVIMMMSEKKESFTNLKENFDSLKQKNSCNTCKVRNQG